MEDYKLVIEAIKKKKAALISEWKKGGKRHAFWKLARKIAETKSSGQPVEGLKDGDKIAYDKESRDKIASKYLEKLFANIKKPTKWNFGIEAPPISLFSEADLLRAIDAHNPGKAVGVDLFDSRALKNRILKKRFAL